MTDLRSLVEQEVEVRRVSATNGGEHASPCPWCGGTDRFRLWPEQRRYWCRQCGRKGDAIQFLRDYHGLSFKEACDAVGRQALPPSPQRQTERDAIQNVREDFLHWDRERLEMLTSLYRTKAKAIAAWHRFIALRIPVSVETERLWQDLLWQLRDELLGFETWCDLFTYDRHAKERLHLWDGMQGARRRKAA